MVALDIVKRGPAASVRCVEPLLGCRSHDWMSQRKEGLLGGSSRAMRAHSRVHTLPRGQNRNPNRLRPVIAPIPLRVVAKREALIRSAIPQPAASTHPRCPMAICSPQGKPGGPVFLREGAQPASDPPNGALQEMERRMERQAKGLAAEMGGQRTRTGSSRRVRKSEENTHGAVAGVEHMGGDAEKATKKAAKKAEKKRLREEATGGGESEDEKKAAATEKPVRAPGWPSSRSRGASSHATRLRASRIAAARTRAARGGGANTATCSRGARPLCARVCRRGERFGISLSAVVLREGSGWPPRVSRAPSEP